MNGDSPADFGHAPFAARHQYVDRFVEVILGFLGERVPERILDIGCGGGELILSLADRIETGRLVGVDISMPNVDAARKAASTRADSARFEFSLADYLTWRTEDRFDLVVSYSTLHLIPGSSEELFARVAGHMANGGILVYAMPYECVYNRMLNGVRRVFRLCRSAATDRLILNAGKLLHGGMLSDEQLAERVRYMYELPVRMSGPNLHRLLAERFGLALIGEHDEIQVSVARPKHRSSAYRNYGRVP